jgi:hypothetical protein
MQKAQADHRAWLESLYDDGTSEGSHTDVARPGSQDASGSGGEPATPGPVPAGQPSPRAAFLAEAELAERIRQTPMSAWAEERQRLIRASTSTRGLFG